MRRVFGKHIVVDSEICHGRPTFRGTRILVTDVLEQVAKGLPRESIQAQWRGSIKTAAISEAVRFAIFKIALLYNSTTHLAEGELPGAVLVEVADELFRTLDADEACHA